MDFSLTDEQRQLRQSVRAFAEAEIAPHVMEWDEASRFPSETVAQLAGLGLLGVIFPEKYGGAGLGYAEYVIAIEELARIDGSLALIVAAHTSLCANHIYKFGTPAQREKYLPRLASGEWLGCWSLTEPGAGSDAGGTTTVGEKCEGGWRINGAKTFTTNGHYASLCVAMAVTDRAAGHHGISAFIVEKGTPGFTPGKKENKLGLRASDTSEVVFTDCLVPAGNLLGREGHGFIDSLAILDGGRISIAAFALGMAQGAFETAARHAKQRRQFGKPIAEFQAIQFKLADMATQIDAARLLTYRAAWLADQARAAGDPPQHHTAESAMAKLFAAETAVRVAGEAVQVLGGYGFIKDYPAEKFYRDVKLTTIGEGTSEIQRLVIARQLLRRG
ncbi:MAG TPA: acyl-CoA dehydrogenase family protein [Patescibacteria group bacterium]|nr:acyl-CoA dehydrogenase family protein [Patescibacteria group bacterium]